MVIQWLVRWRHTNSFSDASIQSDSGQSVNSGQLYIYNATNALFDAMATLLGFGEKFGNIMGLVVRISELDLILDNLAKQQAASVVSSTTEQLVQIKNLTISCLE